MQFQTKAVLLTSSILGCVTAGYTYGAAAAEITTTTTTVYTYDFPGQGPSSTSTSTTTDGSCPPNYGTPGNPSGGGSDPYDPNDTSGGSDADDGGKGSYKDTDGDSKTDTKSGMVSGSPDGKGGYTTDGKGEDSGNPDATGGGDSEGSDGSDGSKVLCTYFYHKGMLPKKIWLADLRYARDHLSEATVRGYHVWAVPLVRVLQTGHHPLLERMLYVIVRDWAYEMAYITGVVERSNFIGRMFRRFGEPLCRLIGRFAPAQNYRRLWA